MKWIQHHTWNIRNKNKNRQATLTENFKTILTSMGSIGFPKISFKTGKSSLCIVVTSPSLKTELKRPARPAICSACEVEMVSISFSPFSFTLGLTRELKMILLMLLKDVRTKTA